MTARDLEDRRIAVRRQRVRVCVREYRRLGERRRAIQNAQVAHWIARYTAARVALDKPTLERS